MVDRVKIDASKKAFAAMVGALGSALRDAESDKRSHRRLATSEARWRKLASLGLRWDYDVVWGEEPGDRGWIVEARPAEAPNALALELLPIIQQHSGEQGMPETARATLLRLIAEREVSKENAKLLDELLGALGKHCGETGMSEGAVETLVRLIAERDSAKEMLAFRGAKKPKRGARKS